MYRVRHPSMKGHPRELAPMTKPRTQAREGGGCLTNGFIGPDVAHRARATLGHEAQMRVLGEELAEAAVAVMRALNGKGTLAQVREKLVDVESLRLSLGNDLGTDADWLADQQRKRAKLLAKLDGGV